MAKDKIIFIGYYLLSFKGGAEHSIFEQLKELSKKYDVEAYTFDPLVKDGRYKRSGITVHNTKMLTRFPQSIYIELFLNSGFISRTLKDINTNGVKEIIVQSSLAPYAAKFARKYEIPYIYYIRDENQLNEFHNYEKGLRHALKNIKSLAELIPKLQYKYLNKRAICHARSLVSNSKFIQSLLFEKFERKSKVVYPQISKQKFSKVKLDKKEQKYITFIGAGNATKGFSIAKKIADAMPKQKFLFVEEYPISSKQENVTYVPWGNVLDVYKQSKVVIFPSIWNEAYGRVVAEAAFLKIPVVSSNKGGISEANPDKKLIVSDVHSIDEWVSKIKLALKR